MRRTRNALVVQAIGVFFYGFQDRDHGVPAKSSLDGNEFRRLQGFQAPVFGFASHPEPLQNCRGQYDFIGSPPPRFKPDGKGYGQRCLSRQSRRTREPYQRNWTL